MSNNPKKSLRPRRKGDRFWYPLLQHPVSRLLKFERFLHYLNMLPDGLSRDVVLDYGSGDRPYEELLLTKFKRYIAADYEVANAIHTKKPDVFIDESSIKMNDQEVDCVVLTEVMEHVYDPKKVLAEIHRILKPGGQLIGTVPFAIYEHEAPYDYHRYTFYCLKRMFEETGFKISKLEYVGDLSGVVAIGFTHMLKFPVSVVRPILGRHVCKILTIFARAPEYFYYCLYRSRLRPQKANYFRKYPVGFSFMVEKASVDD